MLNMQYDIILQTKHDSLDHRLCDPYQQVVTRGIHKRHNHQNIHRDY